MKLIKRVEPPCPCVAKLYEFAQSQADTLYLGSQVECDCGQLYTMTESQRDGFFWTRAYRP